MNITIKNQEGNLVVSSREVAKNFEKEHFHVTRDIENITKALKNTENPFLEDQPTKNGGLKNQTLKNTDSLKLRRYE